MIGQCKHHVPLNEHCPACAYDREYKQPKSGVELIDQERERQINEEGWTPEHDDDHVEGELAAAAACYAMTAIDTSHSSLDSVELHDFRGMLWPWPDEEIDRLQRLSDAKAGGGK